ncbi:MAG: glutamyl-tRNA reductase, partial [Polaribacter sp.]
TGASKPTITKEHIPTDKPMLILDLSMPNNVADEVGEMPNVTLVNVDELSKVTDKTLEIRKQEIPKAEAIIKEHKAEFYEWLNHRKFVPAINALKMSLQEIQQNEINFHKKKIQDFNEEHAEAITSRMIQKITTQFVKHLKEDDTSINESIAVMSKVFEMSLETA